MGRRYLSEETLAAVLAGPPDAARVVEVSALPAARKQRPSRRRTYITHRDLTLAGLDGDTGTTYRIWFKNENLVTWRDGVPALTCTDLICVLDGDSGEPVTNPNARVGQRLAVIGLPAPASWRTADGLKVLSPRHFGFDIDYAPLQSTATS